MRMGENGVAIEPARAEDLPQILRLYEELNAAMSKLQPQNFRPAAQKEDFVRSVLESRWQDFLLAKEDGAAVGFALVEDRETPPHPAFIPRRFAYLMDLVVTEGRRGRGVGRALLAAVERWARARGGEFIELGVLSENLPAIGVYASYGFAENRKVMRMDLK